MRISEIRTLPTVYEDTTARCNKIHESIFRSYAALQKVRELLAEGTPPVIVVDMIDDMTDCAFAGAAGVSGE